MSGGIAGRLAGKRVLLVEDEGLIASMVADMLEDLGAEVVGPAASIAEGVALAETSGLSAAVLDINIRGDSIDPVAERLTARGIPFLFATGYGTQPSAWPHVPVIDKPYSIEKLAAVLLALAAPRPESTGV
jgi:CheY-like chemotaxis protein